MGLPWVAMGLPNLCMMAHQEQVTEQQACKDALALWIMASHEH